MGLWVFYSVRKMEGPTCEVYIFLSCKGHRRLEIRGNGSIHGPLRSEMVSGKLAFLRMHISFSNATWEKPLWDDLFETALYRLFAISSDGHKNTLGYLSKAGLTEDVLSVEDRAWQMESSPCILLQNCFPQTAGIWRSMSTG